MCLLAFKRHLQNEDCVSLMSTSKCIIKKVIKGREDAETYLSIHAKSLERVVDQASHGLICETASFRATSEHVRHC